MHVRRLRNARPGAAPKWVRLRSNDRVMDCGRDNKHQTLHKRSGAMVSRKKAIRSITGTKARAAATAAFLVQGSLVIALALLLTQLVSAQGAAGGQLPAGATASQRISPTLVGAGPAQPTDSAALAVAAVVPTQASPPEADSAGSEPWPPKRRQGRRPPIGGLNLPMKAAAQASKPKRATPYHGTRQTTKSREYYASAWGVDHLRAAYTSSGNLVRFTFRVVQPQLAKPLGDRAASPYLYAPKNRAVLQVPTMEKIGQLRQLGNMEADKEYWMVFSNKGNLVHPGDRVDIMIGRFRAGDLLVE